MSNAFFKSRKTTALTFPRLIYDWYAQLSVASNRAVTVECNERKPDCCLEIEGTCEAEIIVSELTTRNDAYGDAVKAVKRRLKQFCKQNDWKLVSHSYLNREFTGFLHEQNWAVSTDLKLSGLDDTSSVAYNSSETQTSNYFVLTFRSR